MWTCDLAFQGDDGRACSGLPSAARVNDILRERRGVSADTALRLARYFDTDALSWLNLQTAFELRTAEITSGKVIAKQVRKRAA
ncbi:MAG: addiction module antidote protein, HigA family [Rhodospirillales bacterium]|nr:MAG: addiction module antidote protein, HigA family [Rhodospirillales bacterium]